MYRIRRYPGPRVALLCALSLWLAASVARAAPVPPSSFGAGSLGAQTGARMLAPSLPACPPGLPEVCTLLPGSGVQLTLATRPAQPARPGRAALIGVQAAIGAGVTGFLNQRARAVANPGGSWEFRVTLGSRLPIAVEGAYIGSKQNIAMLGLERNGFILGTGAEAGLRVNVTPGPLQPYFFMGAGMTRYQLRNTQLRTADGRTSDDVIQVPFGVGLSVRARHAFLDLRGTGRLMYNDTLMGGLAAPTASVGPIASLTITARLGWEF